LMTTHSGTQRAPGDLTVAASIFFLAFSAGEELLSLWVAPLGAS
jgi:hypothetical protein